MVAAIAADTDDTKRAMLGLCTSNGQFFSTSTAGDTVLRSTDNSALLFGEAERADAWTNNGNLTIGKTAGNVCQCRCWYITFPRLRLLVQATC